MENKVLFSVVMPVFKVENYLRDAIESVLNQTNKSFEIILVDDASPDGCSAICDEYAEKYENIKAVHHQKNLGLSMARNTGLHYVTGEYVSFMDSDDYIDNNLFEKAAESLTENKADCIIFGIREEYCDKNGSVTKTFDLTYGKEERISTREALRKTVIELEKKTFYGYAWNKFYLTEIIRQKSLSFEKVTLIEDIVFNIAFFDNISSLNILNIAPYHYLKRANASLTNKFVPEYYKLHRRRVSDLLRQYEKWDLCDDYICCSIGNIYARYIYSALQRNCDPRSKMDKQMRKSFLNNVFSDELFIKLAPYIKSDGYSGILYNNLKNKRTALCLIFARMIYIIKEKLPIVFAVAKQKR